MQVQEWLCGTRPPPHAKAPPEGGVRWHTVSYLCGFPYLADEEAWLWSETIEDEWAFTSEEGCLALDLLRGLTKGNEEAALRCLLVAARSALPLKQRSRAWALALRRCSQPGKIIRRISPGPEVLSDSTLLLLAGPLGLSPRYRLVMSGVELRLRRLVKRP